jgi:hypothetical protein
MQSGIGAELTRKLLSEGWKVAAFDIPAQRALAQKLADELGENFTFLQCDISRYDEQAHAFSAVFQKWGRLDALCANAGIIDRSSIYILKWRHKTEYNQIKALCLPLLISPQVASGTRLIMHGCLPQSHDLRRATGCPLYATECHTWRHHCCNLQYGSSAPSRILP